MKIAGKLAAGIALLLAACGDARPPTITYAHGQAEVRFGTDSVDLGAMPVAPKLHEYKHEKAGTLFLVEFSRGDSCPSQYLALLRKKGYRNLGEIGNCNEVTADLHSREAIRLVFDALPEADRKKQVLEISESGLRRFPD